MRIDITVVGVDGVGRDVAVEAPGTTPVSEVARALGVDVRALTGGAVPCDADLASSGLRSGALVPAPDRPRASGSMVLTVTAGSAAGQVLPLRRGRMLIGRADGCDLVLAEGRVSRRHAEILVAGGVVSVRDLGSTHGTWLDARRVGAVPVVVEPDDPIRVGDAELVVRRSPEVAGRAHHIQNGRVLVTAAPRSLLPPLPEEILLPEPARQRARSSRSLSAVLPALGGVALAAALASPLYLAVSAISPLALLAEGGAGRLRGRRARRHATAEVRAASRLGEARAAAARTRERAALRHETPDPAQIVQIAAAAGRRLWERRGSDPDLLSVRIGLVETQSRVRVRRGTQLDPPAPLGQLPYRVDLREAPLRIAGPQGMARALARWVVLQLATLVSPADLQLALFCPPHTAEPWRWARWLPQLRAVATNREEQQHAVALLSTCATGQILAVADCVPGRLATALGDLAAQRGWGLVLVSGDPDGPPGRAGWAADLGSATLTTRSGEAVDLRADGISGELAETVARNLAPLAVEGGTRRGLPAHCSLRELLGLDRLDPAAVRARWELCAGRLQTPLGADGRQQVVLDLQRDGPHVLVAGTTGSGKSELLRTLVLGLAASVPPDALQFLLVDFKGGATFAALAGLPHTAAVLSDLDTLGTDRALRSLESELRRRERILGTAGAPDLERFRPIDRSIRLPRLVVIIDEFAALARHDERLLPGLVSVAQRGRSLGFHLVLATQRPGACVSAEVRANTSVRIALRTVSSADSVDVIDVPDAAELDPRQPGLALIRTDGEPVLFQTAGAGIGGADPDPAGLTVIPLDRWRRPQTAADRPPDPEAAVSELVEVVRAAAPIDASAGSSLWVPPLPASLPAVGLPADRDPLSVPWALLDLPGEQRQETLSLDLGVGGGVLLTGGPGSGRSTALAALAVTAAKRLDGRMHLHVVDLGGRLSALSQLPVTGTAVFRAAGVETAAALIAALCTEVERRTRSFGAPVDNRTGGPDGPDAPEDRKERQEPQEPDERQEPDEPGTRHRWPPVLLLVDGWEELCSAAENFDGGRCGDQLLELMRRCRPVGITVVLTGDRATLAGRVTGAATRRFVLPLADRSDYGTAGIPTAAVPPDPPPGRALRVPDGAQLQFGFVGSAPNRWVDAVGELAHGALDAERVPSGPLRLRELPECVRLAEVADRARQCGELPFIVGPAGSTAVPLTVDLARGARALVVAGPPRSGRSTVLISALSQLACRPGIRTAVLASPRSPLRRAAAEAGIGVVGAGEVPADQSRIVLVDDAEQLAGSPAGDWILERLTMQTASVTIVASVRSDQLAAAYRGLVAELRALGSALLLQPSAADADLFGIPLPRGRRCAVPGRGILVADPAWGLPEPAVRVQVALP